MTPHYADEHLSVYLGDCLEVMPTLSDASVDAVVTDPPAGISFMGKVWDHHKGGRDQWVAWMTEVMAECLRVLKPGGHALVWALPRTSHWTAWALDEAGFEVRDRLIHCFASGFPKSLNLPGGLGTALKPAYEDWWLARKPLQGTVAANVLRHGTGALNIDGTRIGTAEDTARAPALVADTPAGFGRGAEMGGQGSPLGRWPPNLILTSPIFDGDTPGVVGGGETSSGSRNGQYDGSGAWSGPFGPVSTPVDGDTGTYSRFFLIAKEARNGREPAVRGQLVERATHTLEEAEISTASNRRCQKCGLVKFGQPHCECPDPVWVESSKRENSHPTVKPLELMRHLVRLVTPPGGTVLDCFLGSGTTALAAIREGFRCIGVEREAEYVAITMARLHGTQAGMGL